MTIFSGLKQLRARSDVSDAMRFGQLFAVEEPRSLASGSFIPQVPHRLGVLRIFERSHERSQHKSGRGVLRREEMLGCRRVGRDARSLDSVGGRRDTFVRLQIDVRDEGERVAGGDHHGSILLGHVCVVWVIYDENVEPQHPRLSFFHARASGGRRGRGAFLARAPVFPGAW